MTNYSDKTYEILSIINRKMKESDMVLILSIIEDSILFDGIETLSTTNMEIMSELANEIESLIKSNNKLSEDKIKEMIKDKDYKKIKNDMSFSNIEINYFTI